MSSPRPHFLVSTTDSMPSHRMVAYRGLARGSSVRAAPLHADVMASLQNLVGGELPDYTKVLAECREEALDRMIEHARSLGANAVVGLRFSSAEVTRDAAELIAYGTAVEVLPCGEGEPRHAPH